MFIRTRFHIGVGGYWMPAFAGMTTTESALLHHAPGGRDGGEEGGDRRVPPGKGEPQKAPRRLVAADDGRVDDPALAPLKLEGAGAGSWPFPPFPLDAGMVDAGHHIGEEGERDEEKQDA